MCDKENAIFYNKAADSLLEQLTNKNTIDLGITILSEKDKTKIPQNIDDVIGLELIMEKK